MILRMIDDPQKGTAKSGPMHGLLRDPITVSRYRKAFDIIQKMKKSKAVQNAGMYDMHCMV